jgi:hypothetical protein
MWGWIEEEGKRETRLVVIDHYTMLHTFIPIITPDLHHSIPQMALIGT